MKKFKYFLGLTLLMSLVLIPATSQAVSIQDLLNQIAKLTAELNFYRRGSITPVVPACTFVHDLSLGDGEEGDGLSKEVSALQKVLIKGGYLNIKNPTGWFGKMTQVAVKKWQGANIPSVPATGAIGENDRNFLCGSITPVEPPVVGKAPWINTVYHINESLMYRIEGERLENSKVYFDGSSVDTAHVSSRMINFWPPNNIGNGTYPVYVKNSYGKSNTVYLTIGNNSGITINSVSGPNSLNVGQTGTWKVNVTGSAMSELTYSVVWGEEDGYAGVSASGAKTAISQTGTFTHSYTQAGTYTVRFKVTDNRGVSAQTSLTVVVGNNSIVDNGKCGLTVANPTNNSKVAFPLTVNGVVDNRNASKLGCSWTMFEGDAGTAQMYFRWLEHGVVRWSPVGQEAKMLVNNWMTTGPENFTATLNFNNEGIGLPAGTPMKVVFTEETGSGLPPIDTFELPFYLLQ